MSILQAQQLGISYGAFDLFKGISLTIANDAKIGLIGPNGVGKFTIMMILAGLRTPTTGQVSMAKNRSIGYLRQEAVEAFGNRENSVYHEMLAVFEHLHQRQSQLHELELQMADANGNLDALLAEYGHFQQAFELAGGYDFEVRIQQTLEGLGLGKDAWHMPLNHLSGGQKTRALLARLLLVKPDLLMLDEPTNHLDIPAREALQEVLEEYSGTILLVSHDRYLINRLATRVWEIKDKQLITFNGNYREYILRQTALRNGGQNGNRKILLTQAPMARDNSRETRQRSLDLEKLEGRIREKEKEIQRLSHELQKTGKSGAFEKMHELSNQLAHAEARIEELMQEWEQLVVQ